MIYNGPLRREVRAIRRQPRLRSGLWLCVLVAVGSVFVPQATRAQDVVSELFEMSRRPEGEPIWAPLLRMREHEEAYRADRGAWMSYIQLRAQAEALVGNHEAALGFWESIRPERDSTGALPEGVHPVDAIGLLAGIADTARVIMVNERHHAASDRMLTLRLLPVLYEKGFRYFAAEAFDPADSTLDERGYALEGVTGYYTDECVFGELVREARRIGYRLVAYEQGKGQGEELQELTPQQRRDRCQAQNLRDRIFAKDSDARVLVHAGFNHIKEEASERWSPMALYFRELTGIDPVTVDQTVMGEGSGPGHEHPLRRAVAAAGWPDGPVVLVGPGDRPVKPTGFASDLQVFAPPTRTSGGRPSWLVDAGLRVPVDLSVPECADRTCFVEVRHRDEPASVALDRMEVAGADSIRVLVPPDTPVVVRISDANGAEIRTLELNL